MKKKSRDGITGTSPGDHDTEFRRAVAGAKPLKTDYVEPVRRTVSARARFRRADESAVLSESLVADPEHLEAQRGERLSFRRDHVSQRTLRRLARGSFLIEDEIDLHGLTVAEARESIAKFIASSRSRGLRCVRIVHGKGFGSGRRGPVLKSNVNAWLQRWDSVLAFVSARIVDGGTGAVYVLLRRNHDA